MKEPKLRFKEFKDEWQPRKLSEFSEKINEKNESESYTSALTNSAVYGVVNQQDFFKKDIANPENIERYTIVKDNDYMYNPRISKYAKFGPVNRNKLNATGIVSPMYLVFRTDNTVSLGFLDNYFFSSYWHKYVYSKGNTGARADRIAIKDSDFMNMKILMPSLKEQKKIAKFFADLDNQLELQSNKLETLKRDKKGYLQKMFPSGDSNAPKLRLKGFNDEWKKDKLINVNDYVDYRGATPQKTSSGIQLVTASNIKNGYIDYSADEQYISVDKYEEVMHRGKPQLGDVLITTEAPMGNVAKVDDDNVALAQRVIKYSGKKGIIDNGFLLYYLQSDFFQKDLLRKASGGTVQGIKGSVLHKMIIKYPSIDEQRKIGTFLNSLDRKIVLQQQKVSDLKKQKKAYLQKMFI